MGSGIFECLSGAPAATHDEQEWQERGLGREADSPPALPMAGAVVLGLLHVGGVVQYVLASITDRAALPRVLRGWLSFALRRRGLDEQWIAPVVAAVDDYLDDFRAAFGDDTSWGPAKQIAAALTERGVDLTDRAAVDDAVRALNTERLAQRLLP